VAKKRARTKQKTFTRKSWRFERVAATLMPSPHTSGTFRAAPHISIALCNCNNINTSRVHLACNEFLNFFRKVMKARYPRSDQDVTKAMYASNQTDLPCYRVSYSLFSWLKVLFAGL